MSLVQEWISKLKTMNLQDLQQTLESYSAFGPLPGLLLPFSEAFLPFLPLIVFIAANSNIYGLWFGFLLSWIGASAGAITVFWLARKLGGGLGKRIVKRFPRAEGFFKWIEQKGFTPIFLLACFPFSPSALVNIASGLSSLPFRTFIIATLLGKGVMIFSLSLLSFNIGDLAPWRIAVTIGVVVLMWYGGKRLESRYQLK